MKKIIFFIILLSFVSSVFAGGSADNNQKYWIYRERLKNFVYQSNYNGSGLVIGSRDANEISTGDQAWYLGYYMATLAMEWKLLHNKGFSTAQTEKDLYYAIDGLLRMDQMAEVSQGCGAPARPRLQRSYRVKPTRMQEAYAFATPSTTHSD